VREDQYEYENAEKRRRITVSAVCDGLRREIIEYETSKVSRQSKGKIDPDADTHLTQTPVFQVMTGKSTIIHLACGERGTSFWYAVHHFGVVFLDGTQWMVTGRTTMLSLLPHPLVESPS